MPRPFDIFNSFLSLLLQNIENNNNDIKWKRTPPLSRSKTLPDLLYQDQDAPIVTFNKDSPATCKVFPKTPKIALTIDDLSIGDIPRRKSSGSSVNSSHSTIEPHIYDFQESEKNIESSLIIRFDSKFFRNSFSPNFVVLFKNSFLHSLGVVRQMWTAAKTAQFFQQYFLSFHTAAQQ